VVQLFFEEIAMRKLATLGLTVGLGLAAAGMSLPASAGVYVGVGVPGVVVAPPAVTFPGYYYGPHYYPYGYARFGYGWGYGPHGYRFGYGGHPGLGGHYGGFHGRR
jgi:hypothetical protein